MILEIIEVLKLNVKMTCSVLKIYRFKFEFKIAVRGIVSEFDETSSIGSVIVSYYRISILIAIGVVV